MKILKKIIKILLIAFATLYLGVIIGYSVIGNGKLVDALDLSALKHIVDIIFH